MEVFRFNDSLHLRNKTLCYYWVNRKVHSGFFGKMLRKNPNKLFGQPNSLKLKHCLKLKLWPDFTGLGE